MRRAPTPLPDRRRALGAALALVGAVACARPAAPPPPSSPSPVLGKTVPAFRRLTLQGAPFDTAEVGAGAGAGARVLVIDFFAAYCRPCQRTLPALEALHRERPDVAFVGVSLDETPEDAVRMINRHRLTFPVIHDRGHVLAGRFRVTELPTAFVVDGGGRIIWTAGPAQPEDALPRAVAAAAHH